MQISTIINATDVEVSARDESINVLNFNYNKKIFYLPIKVSEKFPSLEVYYAFSCSLTTISKANFAGLSRLRVLDLSVNQIEKLRSDTFEGLETMDTLYLCKFLLFRCLNIY